MNNTRLTIFGMPKAQNSLPIMAVFDLHPTENNIVLDDMQKIVSSYTKDKTQNATKNLIENSEVFT